MRKYVDMQNWKYILALAPGASFLEIELQLKAVTRKLQKSGAGAAGAANDLIILNKMAWHYFK